MSAPVATNTSWQVDLDLFRGPLHTLLDLIERRELPVTRISLVEVADQYLALVRGSGGLDLDLTAEFLHVAARLILLKSQALLPHQQDDEPAGEAETDDDLEARLLAYRRFRDAARLLAARQEAGPRMFGRVALSRPALLPAGPVQVAPERLRRAALRAMERVVAARRAQEAAPAPLVPFRQVLHAVIQRLLARRRTRFHDLVGEASDVIVAITMFLAVLELVHQRRLTMRQHETFGPIDLAMEETHDDSATT